MYFLSNYGYIYDCSPFNGRCYWPIGPLPAVVLMPFVYIYGNYFIQGFLQFPLNILNMYLLFRIAQKITGNKELSLWLSFGYIFATAYINVGLVANSWYFAQVVATTAILLSLYEFFYSRRWWLIGIWVACAVATRSNLILMTAFFLPAIFLTDRVSPKIKSPVVNMLFGVIPLIIMLMLLCIYNFLRFHNIMVQGYNYDKLDLPILVANRNAGLWSIVHFPANIYYLFLKGLDPVIISGTKILRFPFITYDTWGLSIFITSPIFLWIYKTPFNVKNVKFALIAAILILISLLGYYSIGWTQYGYRYALDLYPFLFIMLSYAMKNSKSLLLFKIVIILSFILNMYLISTSPWL